MNQSNALAWVKLIAEKYGGTMEVDIINHCVEIDVPEENAERCAKEVAGVIGAVDVEYATIQ
jgi:hypothetical protein